MISVTLRFDYPDFDGVNDVNDINNLLTEMSPDEILANAQDAGEVVSMEVRVH